MTSQTIPDSWISDVSTVLDTSREEALAEFESAIEGVEQGGDADAILFDLGLGEDRLNDFLELCGEEPRYITDLPREEMLRVWYS